MKKLILCLNIILLITTIACKNTYPDHSSDIISDALTHAAKKLQDKGYKTASSFKPNDYLRFRIMVEDDISNETAKELVLEFLNALEEKLGDLSEFKKAHKISFELKSKDKDKVLLSGKIEGDNNEIWWQF